MIGFRALERDPLAEDTRSTPDLGFTIPRTRLGAILTERSFMNLNYLLIFVPIAFGLDQYGAGPIVVFAMSSLAIIPLCELIGKSTERIAESLGPTIGGLLNATMGNVPELIIGIFALKNGLQSIVKASIAGSLLGNLLCVLGVAMLAGGIRHRVQKFNVRMAGVNSMLLILAAIGLIIPAVFHFSTADTNDEIGVEISVILFLAYLASLVFTLITHQQTFSEGEPEKLETRRSPGGSRVWRAVVVLAVSTIVLAVMSESLTGSIEPLTKKLGLTSAFAGIFLLATVGNISSLINAVQYAMKDKMDLTIATTLGAGTQVALLVAPALVFASYLMGTPMDLHFSRFEVVAIALAVFVGRQLTVDGESTWLEGILLVAVYAMMGVGFYYLK